MAAPVVEQHAGVGPAGGVGINQRAGQPAVELGLRLRGIEMAQGHLAVGPRQIKGAVGHAGALIFFHVRQRGFPAFGHAKNQVNDGGFMGRQSYRAPQRNDWIQHGTDGVGQRRTALHRGRVGQGSAAPDKSGAIGFAGNLPLFTALAHHQMQQPRRPFLLGTGAAGAENGGGFLREFRLHEEIAESGMRRVRVRHREHHFRVTGQFNLSRRRRPTSSRRSSGSSGITSGKAGLDASSRTGGNRSSGSASSPTKSSPR